MPELPKYTCQRCGYQWAPRISKEPKECPSCKSRYWRERPKDDRKSEQQRTESEG